MEQLILVCVAIFLPLGLFVANKLIDRTTIKEKDSQIADLGRKVVSLVSEKAAAETGEKVARDTAEAVATLAGQNIDTARSMSSLEEEARRVTTEQEAIDLARRQVEANNR